MRRAAVIPLAASALMIAAAPALSQGQQPRPLPPPGGPVQQQQQQQQKPLPPPGGPVQQQQQQQQQQAAPQQAAPKPYKPIPISAPKPLNDPGFDAFRKQLGDIAKRKDRAGLAKLIAANFFWLGEKGDRADKKRPGIDNLTRAMALNAKDGSGWEALAGYAAEPTAMPIPDKKDTVCAPADPVFDIKQLEELAKATGTDPSDWGYPMQPGVEMRAAAQANAPVVEKLGMHFVRVMEDDGPEPPAGAMPMLKVVAPSGKVGFVPADALSPLGNDQLCYVKDAAGWKIAGFVGGQEQ